MEFNGSDDLKDSKLYFISSKHFHVNDCTFVLSESENRPIQLLIHHSLNGIYLCEWKIWLSALNQTF